MSPSSNNRMRTRLDLDEGGVVVRVPETTLEAKHDSLHVQPHGLPEQDQSVNKTKGTHTASRGGRGRGLDRGYRQRHTDTSVKHALRG